MTGLALKILPTLVAALLVPTAAVQAADLAGHQSRTESLFGLASSCEGTSRAGYWSCYNEKSDDFWRGLGTCNYISDLDDRNACYDENRIAREEGNDECLSIEEAKNEVCDLLGEDRYEPEYAPEDFVDPGTIGDTVEPNPYFPLVPGYRWVYEGNGEHIEVEVLNETREIDGVLCTVVRDTVTELAEEDGDGESSLQADEEDTGTGTGSYVEDTLDWYAQDTDGNVWYFGEISKSFEDGVLVDLEGSWTTGVEGAKPGITMPAMPAAGMVYRQEFLINDAEDIAKVVSVEAMPDLDDLNPGDCSLGCLQTEEWTPLAPDDPHEYKYYQAGVGTVQEAVPDTGETLDLIEFSTGE